MPIPFRDADDADELGLAAFLKLEPCDAAYLGALLVINARGEPFEFAYNRLELAQRFLWRPADLRRHAQRRLTASLLSVCTHNPRLLLCLADEVGRALFALDLELSIPVGRVGPAPAASRRVDPSTGEVLEEPPVELAWQPEPPAAGSPERALVDRLSSHGLLLEPFERASLGLREVFGPPGGGAP